MQKKEQKAKNIAEKKKSRVFPELTLSPIFSYGCFYLGANISDYRNLVELDPDRDALEYDSYIATNIDYEIDLWPNHSGIIKRIHFVNHCYYQGYDLIGTNIFHFMKMINKEPSKLAFEWIMGINGKRGQNQRVYDFDFNNSQGIQVWTWKKRVRCIIIYSWS